MESDGVAAAHVFLHAESREGDAKNWMFRVDGLHEIDADAIRQTDVAHENVEALIGGKFERRPGNPVQSSGNRAEKSPRLKAESAAKSSF